MLTLDKFEEASEKVKEVTLETKLVYSDFLSEQTGNKVYLKPENMQFTGAYKVRGAYYKISTLTETERKKGLITASAGNHAQGVAYAAKCYGCKAVIVMPTTTPLIKVNRTKSYGAEVVLCGDVYDEACQKAYELAEEKGLFLMEGFWIRFLPVLQKMQELITEGKLGEIRYIRSEYGFVAKGDRKVRKFNPQLGGGALLDIGIYNLGFLNMIMGKNPDSFTSDVHMTDAGTDDFSVIHLHYPQENGQGTQAVVTTAIGLDIQRKAAVIGTKGSIYLDDFQKAETMTVSLSDGEEYEIEIPFEINGFEYQIREASNCIRAGRTHSGIYTPQMSLQTLSLIDDIRASWNMKFPFEK